MGYLDQYKKKYDPTNPMATQQEDPFAFKPTQADQVSDFGPAQSGAVDFSSAYKNTNGATTQAMGSVGSKSGGVDLAQVGSAAAAGSSVGPWGAAIAAVGSLASQYLGQKAADERAKRERSAAIHKGHGEDQQQAINQIMANNARALR